MLRLLAIRKSLAPQPGGLHCIRPCRFTRMNVSILPDLVVAEASVRGELINSRILRMLRIYNLPTYEERSVCRITHSNPGIRPVR